MNSANKERALAHIASDTGIAYLRLIRRDRHNAIDMAMVTELRDAAQMIKDHADQARVVLIEADGPNFSVGGDLQHFSQHFDRLADELVSMIGPYHETLITLAELPLPVVCAVGGAVAGGALGLLWVADIVVAADDLKLVTAFSRLGVSGDGGSSWFLPRLVGLRRAQEIILESPVLDAAQALNYGLVTRVAPREALHAEAEATARSLAAGPTIALAAQKSLLRNAGSSTMREGLAAELEAMRVTGGTRDAMEGMTAYAARREPAFERK